MNKNCRLLNLFEKTIRSVNFLHRIGPRSKCLVGCSPANIFEAWLVFGNILYWQFLR